VPGSSGYGTCSIRPIHCRPLSHRIIEQGLDDPDRRFLILEDMRLDANLHCPRAMRGVRLRTSPVSRLKYVKLLSCAGSFFRIVEWGGVCRGE
jgi:hypothetical protein